MFLFILKFRKPTVPRARRLLVQDAGEAEVADLQVPQGGVQDWPGRREFGRAS